MNSEAMNKSKWKIEERPVSDYIRGDYVDPRRDRIREKFGEVPETLWWCVDQDGDDWGYFLTREDAEAEIIKIEHDAAIRHHRLASVVGQIQRAKTDRAIEILADFATSVLVNGL